MMRLLRQLALLQVNKQLCNNSGIAVLLISEGDIDGLGIVFHISVELQIRVGIKDNSKIIFIISQ